MGRVVVLIGAVTAAFWHFREVAVTANTGGKEILFVTAPLAFVLASLATWLWFGGRVTK